MKLKPLFSIMAHASGARRAGVILVCLQPWLVQAQPSLNVVNVPGYPGSMLELPISLRHATNVTALQFDLEFNPDRILTGTVLSTVFSNHVVRAREIAPGRHRVLVYSQVNESVTVTNTIAAVTMDVTVSPQERVGSGPLTPYQALVARPDATALFPLSLNPGTIFVRPLNRRPDGVVDLFLPSVPDRTYRLQATTTFEEWVNISTNTALGNFMDWVDADAPLYQQRFYRSAEAEVGAAGSP